MRDVTSLLDRVAAWIVRAADQPDLPGTDVPRDWSRWRREDRYEGRDDPSLPQEERDRLEDAREEHIDRVVDVIDKVASRYAEQEQEVQFTDVDAAVFRNAAESKSTFVEALERFAVNKRLPPTNVIRQAVDRLDEDLIVDIMRELCSVHTADVRPSLIVDSYTNDTAQHDDIQELVDAYMRPADWRKAEAEDWDDLIAGLDDQDLKEVAEKIEATWEIKYRQDKVSGSLTVRIDVKMYYGIDDIAELEDKLETAMSEKSTEDFGFDDKPVVRELPAGATADQMALLRWFELKGVDQVKSQELRQDPIARLPYVKGLLDANKILTPDIVRNTPDSRPDDALAAIQQVARYDVIPFTMDVQVMFDAKPNWSFVVSIDRDGFRQAFGTDMPAETAQYMGRTNHPNVGRDRLTVGWVRFTEFGRDIWIDEVQTDLMRGVGKIPLPEDLQEQMGGFTPFYRWLMEQFVREMRARGYGRFFLPNLDMKNTLYDASPPPSVYEEVPPKVRFTRTDVEINFDDDTIKPVKPDTKAVMMVDDALAQADVYRDDSAVLEEPERFGQAAEESAGDWWLKEPKGAWYLIGQDGQNLGFGGTPPLKPDYSKTWADVPEAVKEAWRAIQEENARLFVLLSKDSESWAPDVRGWMLAPDGEVLREFETREQVPASFWRNDQKKKLTARDIPAQTKPVLRDQLITRAYRASGRDVSGLGRQRNMWVLASLNDQAARLDAVACAVEAWTVPTGSS
jgi:hypothetical protein